MDRRSQRSAPAKDEPRADTSIRPIPDGRCILLLTKSHRIVLLLPIAAMVISGGFILTIFSACIGSPGGLKSLLHREDTMPKPQSQRTVRRSYLLRTATAILSSM